MPRDPRTHLAARVVPAILAILLVACGTPATSSAPGDATIPPDTTPGPVGSGLGAFPGVEGFAYREEPGIVPGFVEGAEQSLAGAAELAIVQAAVASRGEAEVSVIAFGFPGVEDTAAVDSFARVIDGLEDALQAGAERGLDGEAYVLTSEGRSVVMAPWGRTEHLVFLFLAGPTEATQDLAAAILNAVD